MIEYVHSSSIVLVYVAMIFCVLYLYKKSAFKANLVKMIVIGLRIVKNVLCNRVSVSRSAYGQKKVVIKLIVKLTLLSFLTD